MAEEVVFNARVEGGASLIDLKNEFKELNKELANAEEGTTKYNETLQKLGKVKDDMNELREIIGSLNPEGKVAAFQNLAGKLAGGFQAATGAAALFGGQTEELQKQLLKVQAATAFAEGIQSIIGLDGAFKVLKATLLSFNPIILAVSAAVLAIGLAYKAWSGYMSEAAQNDALLNNELERQKNLQESINAEIERNLALDKELAKNQKEIIDLEYKAERQRYIQIATRLVLLREVKDKSDEQIEDIKKLEQQEADSYNKMLLIRIQFNKQVRSDDKETYDNWKKLRDERLKEEAAIAKEFQAREADIQNELIDREEREFKDALERQKAQDEALAQQSLADLKLRVDSEYNYYKEQEQKNRDEADALRRQRDAEEIEAERVKQDAKRQEIDNYYQAAQGLSDAYFQFQLNNAVKGSEEEKKIKEKQFKVNKAFAIAGAVIDGVRSVQNALLVQPYPVALALAVSAGALAAANIAKIAATKFDGGSGSTPSLSSSSTSVPTINTPQTVQPGTRLNEDGTVRKETEATRAYVVERDISDKQKQSGRLEKQGKF